MLSKVVPLLYIQITPHLITIRNVRNGRYTSEPAIIAIKKNGEKQTVVSTGHAALATNSIDGTTTHHPFAHPRSLISDFSKAEALMQAQVKKTLDFGFFSLAPIIVIHPMGNPEGGFTELEVRALKELAHTAGAKKAYIWSGRPLSDLEAELPFKNHQGGQWLN